jgi:hypothetical protein
VKNIAVLIDFTEGSKAALQQGIAFAKKSGAQLWALHIIATQEKYTQATTELEQYIQSNTKDGIEVKPLVVIGNLAHACNSGLGKVDADLVIICTHGVKGIFQQLFGAQILKLVQSINFPSLVISEQTTTDLSKATNILFPMGPHPDFLVKIKQTSKFAKMLNASITIYEIDRDGADATDLVNHNVDTAVEWFEQEGISYSKVMEEQKMFSVGFSRQTMEYAVDHQIPILSMMATVSKNDALFGFGDKENFLVNNHGIAVLTCND